MGSSDERQDEGGDFGGGSGGESRTKVREHLANERTLLSWVRTGIGLISFGLVVERLGAELSSAGASKGFGVALALLGCLALIIGTIQFLRSRRGIATGHFVSAVAGYMAIVAGSLILAGIFIALVLLGGV